MNDMAGEGQEPWTELVRLYDQWKVIHRELVAILREAKPVLNGDEWARYNAKEAEASRIHDQISQAFARMPRRPHWASMLPQ